MKKILVILLIIAPVLCFAQSKNKGKIVDKFPLKDLRLDMPLYIVDGVSMKDSFNLDSLNCAQIDNFEILKHPYSSAIYGLRGINGVYIITTKIGKYKDAAQNIKIDDRMLSLNISRLSMNRKEPPLHNIAEALSGCLCDPVFIRPEDKYETIVFAPGYETFLATQKSKDFYSKSYLKTKNLLMVSEWNYRCNNPSIYNPRIYEATIHYDTKTDYGLDVEYELYMFFRFMEKENRMSLINDIAKL